MESKLPQIPLWIRIETGHDSRLTDVLELKLQLEKQGIPVQVSKPWHPSYTSGFECIFEIFASLKIEDILISGVVYDAFKYVAIKVWNCLKSFAEKNNQGDFDPTIIIRLDDVSIVFNGVEFKSIDKQTEILYKIASHIRYLSSQGLQGIDRIDIPCLSCYLPDHVNGIDYNKVWRIRHGAREFAYYYPATKQLIK